MSGLAGSGGKVVALFDNSTACATPSTVTVPAGSSTTTFPVTTSVVTSTKLVTITARVGAGDKTGTLTINP
ncbi:MAG: hypothetical protein ABL949_03375 [Fimbriimonadaceae bacterium]